MPELFFTSDLHLGHVNAATKFRGFATVEEHDEFLIDQWNSVVGPRDRVILLGDACMGTIVDTIKLISRLLGEIWLLPGNHDWVHPAHHGRQDAKPEKIAERERLYHDTFDRILPLQVDVGSHTTLCHLPPYGDHTDEERYSEYRPIDRGQRHIHGHVHDLWADQHNGRIINVGVDVRDFRPVSIDELAALYP